MGRPRRLLLPTPRRLATLFVLLFAAAGFVALVVSTAAPPPDSTAPVSELISTFSIVAFDPDTGDLGVAVQSKFFAVGRVVPFATAGLGAVATQANANTTYGRRGLELLARGHAPEEVIQALIGDDPQRQQRQVGIVDASGSAATFTGDAALPWAGGRTGSHYTVQGNILAGPEVVDAMAEAFEKTRGDLATRMVTALSAGQHAGGDARGRQSAALLVVREGAGYGGFDDRYVELRVEDHPTPIQELQRLLDIRHGQLSRDRAREVLLEAAQASEEDRPGLLGDALEAAIAATVLYPDDGWVWMRLAEVRVARGELESAAEAGREALRRDPWIKTAILRGIAGSTRVVEELLADEDFRSLWEQIEVR